jgi:hypothetical protein
VTASPKVLAYCVLERSEGSFDSAGVDGQPVRLLEQNDLLALYSDFPLARALTQEDAVRFHSVLKSAFDRQAIIPFRFPTFLDNESSLREQLTANYPKYAADLTRLRHFVQMELRISSQQKEESRASGKEYLQAKSRQMRSAEESTRVARETSADLVADFKERATDQGVRLYALTNRRDAEVFRQRIQSINVPASLKILVSGPWPATEFLSE